MGTFERSNIAPSRASAGNFEVIAAASRQPASELRFKGCIDDRTVEAVAAFPVGVADEHAKENAIPSWFHARPQKLKAKL